MRTTALRTSALTIALSLLTAGIAAAATEVTHFKSNGAFATHNSFDGINSLDLTFNKDDQGQTSTTSLFFNKQACNDTGCTGVLGFGTIPNADASVSGGNAKLNTNLANNAGYQCFSFVLDFINGYSQSPISCGAIVIDWKKVPRQSTSSNGHSSTTSGGFSTHQHGQQDSDRATSSGTFFGAAIPTNGAGLIGISKSSVVTIIRN